MGRTLFVPLLKTFYVSKHDMLLYFLIQLMVFHLRRCKKKKKKKKQKKKNKKKEQKKRTKKKEQRQKNIECQKLRAHGYQRQRISAQIRVNISSSSSSYQAGRPTSRNGSALLSGSCGGCLENISTPNPIYSSNSFCGKPF